MEEVRVEALKGNTFYAVAKLRSGDRVQEVDARPSDAIALALRTGSPIYVDNKVWEIAGRDVPKEVEKRSRLGQGLDKIEKEFEEKLQEGKSRPPLTEEQIEEGYQKLFASVFGSET